VELLNELSQNRCRSEGVKELDHGLSCDERDPSIEEGSGDELAIRPKGEPISPRSTCSTLTSARSLT
jgi:hypothetical protein